MFSDRIFYCEKACNMFRLFDDVIIMHEQKI